METNKKTYGNNDSWLYANYSMLIPGLGQSIRGSYFKGIMFFAITLHLIVISGLSLITDNINIGISVVLLFLSMAVYIWNIVDSLKDRKTKPLDSQSTDKFEKDPWKAVFLSQIIIGLGFFYIKKWYLGILTILLFILLGYFFKDMLLYIFVRSFFITIVCFMVYKMALNKELRIKKHILIISSIILILNIFYVSIASYIRNDFISPTFFVSRSMEPAISENSYILISKYDRYQLERGDIVQYNINLLDKNKDLIHRVIAFEGETVEITNGNVYINNQIIFENMNISDEGSFGVNGNIFTVPSNSVYLLGDNSDSSLDSRYFGAVSIDAITGKYKKTVFKLHN